MSDPGYYFLPGDYARDTAHLTNDEDLAYRRLLDAYYSRGGPFPAAVGWLQRVSRVSLDAVQAVADEFFPVNGDGLRHNKRADEEIKKRVEFKLEKSAAGKASWEARKSRGQTTAIVHQRTGVQEPTNGCSISVQTGERTDNELPSPPPSPLPSPKPSPLKKPMSNVKPSDAAIRISTVLLQSIEARITNFRRPNLRSWESEADRMLRLDGRTEEDSVALIAWVERDTFWQGNILSIKKLREKWDQLQAKRNGSVSQCGATQRDKYAHLEEPC